MIGFTFDKRCAVCGRWKTTSDFSRDKSRKDGLDRKCKECHRAYDAARNVKKPKQTPRQQPFQGWTPDELGSFRISQR